MISWSFLIFTFTWTLNNITLMMSDIKWFLWLFKITLKHVFGAVLILLFFISFDFAFFAAFESSFQHHLAVSLARALDHWLIILSLAVAKRSQSKGKSYKSQAKWGPRGDQASPASIEIVKELGRLYGFVRHPISVKQRIWRSWEREEQK